jgi:hypothetical protein
MQAARTLLAVSILVLGMPVGSTPAATLNFPGCGPSIKACIDDAPSGSTIWLKTNDLIEIPASGQLQISKALSLRAAPGYEPKLGREGDAGYISMYLSPTSARTMIFSGITFQQVSVSVEIGGQATGHRVEFLNNRIENDTGSNGGAGISVYVDAPAEAAIKILNNRVNSAGVGIQASASGGPLKIIGNTVTAPVFTDSQGGIFVFAGGEGRVKGTVASNLIHGVAGCGCGTPGGFQARAFDEVVFDLRVLNNTISPAYPDTPSAGESSGIIIVHPYSHPQAKIEAALYNNLVTNAHQGITLYEDDQVAVVGDLNDTYNTTHADHIGSYDLGTLLHEDPLYMSATNFKLQETSPMRDRGRTCMPSVPLPRSDEAGKFRLVDFAVDIGAYEFASTMKGSVPGRNITDTGGSHSIRGTSGVDVVCGQGGDDFIEGEEGTDFLFGGGGDDEVRGADGTDFIHVLDGVESNDEARGGAGTDRCIYDTGDIRESCALPSG